MAPTLVQPGQMELAAKIGLRTQATKEFYDLVIVGAGLAGPGGGGLRRVGRSADVGDRR